MIAHSNYNFLNGTFACTITVFKENTICLKHRKKKIFRTLLLNNDDVENIDDKTK